MRPQSASADFGSGGFDVPGIDAEGCLFVFAALVVGLLIAGLFAFFAPAATGAGPPQAFQRNSRRASARPDQPVVPRHAGARHGVRGRQCQSAIRCKRHVAHLLRADKIGVE